MNFNSKSRDFNKDNNSSKSSTIINEDDFEIFEEIKKVGNNKGNKRRFNKLINRSKTYCNKKNGFEKNKIKIKDITEEEQLRFDFQKEYKKYRIDNNKDFLERMIDDINKRGNMENIMDKFIKQSRLKMNEEQKTITFNRLIEDTNRRLERKEKMLQFKEDEEKENIELLKKALNKDNKKYNAKKWSEIYMKRFETFSKNKYKKYIKGITNILQEEIDLIDEEKPKKLHKIKNKKEAKQIIENNIHNLYNDFMLRKQRKINRDNNYELICKKCKPLYNDKLDKIKKIKKFTKSEKNISNVKKDINKNRCLKDNSQSINKTKKRFCFTPKSLKYKNNFKNTNENKKEAKNNILTGEKISEILINTFLMNHGK